MPSRTQIDLGHGLVGAISYFSPPFQMVVRLRPPLTPYGGIAFSRGVANPSANVYQIMNLI
jgi:hypothetical protein